MAPQQLDFEKESGDAPAARPKAARKDPASLPFSIIVLLKDYYELESRLVQHKHMAAYNINRCRHHVQAEEVLGTFDYDY